jgi:hypothetical protein
MGFETVVRVNLHAVADGALLASSEKPWNLARELEDEIADVEDALKMIGVTAVSVVAKFDA